MDRDRLIAIALALGFVFLIVAIIGVVAVTGFVIFFVANPDAAGTSTGDDTPIIDTLEPGTTPPANTPPSNPPSNTPPEDNEPDPVCGNDELEDGEQCELDSQCGTNEQCNNSCECEAKPPAAPTETEISTLQFDSVVLVPACVALGDEEGIGVSQILIKNTGSSEFSYKGTVRIESALGDTTDNPVTKSIDFKIAPGKTERLYLNQITRTEKFLFLGPSTGTATVKINFGNNYIEFEKEIKGQDQANAGCT